MARKPKNVKIVEASGSFAHALGRPALGSFIESAMTAETVKCFEEGVTDPEQIRERKLAAREEAKEIYRAAEAKAIKEAQAAADAAK